VLKRYKQKLSGKCYPKWWENISGDFIIKAGENQGN